MAVVKELLLISTFEQHRKVWAGLPLTKVLLVGGMTSVVCRMMLSACEDSPCGNKMCLPRYKVCDGIPDCNDAADETNCHGEF